MAQHSCNSWLKNRICVHEKYEFNYMKMRKMRIALLFAAIFFGQTASFFMVLTAFFRIEVPFI